MSGHLRINRANNLRMHGSSEEVHLNDLDIDEINKLTKVFIIDAYKDKKIPFNELSSWKNMLETLLRLDDAEKLKTLISKLIKLINSPMKLGKSFKLLS